MPAGATYEPIATSTVTGSNAGNITFSSISSSYTDLVLVMALQSDRASNGSSSVRLELNADTGTNYSSTYIYGNGTSAISGAQSSVSPMPQIGEAPGGPSLTSVFGFIKVSLFSYAGSTYKTILSEWAADRNGAGLTGRTVGLWRSTSAINSIKITISSQNIVVGSTATLYGITKA
jgi:hypothetical protein